MLLIPFLGSLLERLCNTTEFEVEGWRKLSPLMEILEEHISSETVKNLNVEMTMFDVIDRSLFSSANVRQNGFPKIRHSWIYQHFRNDSSNETKIALFLANVGYINEKIGLENIRPKNIGNHCVIVTGLEKKINGEYLVIESFAGCERTRYISVEDPFYEEVFLNIEAKFKEFEAEEYKPTLENRLKEYGEEVWQEFGKHRRADNIMPQDRYMSFIRALNYSYFQLKFHLPVFSVEISNLKS